VEELAQERSVLEETRTRLSGFLTRVLEEVEIGMSEGSVNVRDLDEARAARTLDGRRPLATPVGRFTRSDCPPPGRACAAWRI
jgi:hypothetical protein